jgi:hypothetical protein
MRNAIRFTAPQNRGADHATQPYPRVLRRAKTREPESAAHHINHERLPGGRLAISIQFALILSYPYNTSGQKDDRSFKRVTYYRPLV